VIHELPLERRTLHGYFSRDLPPVVSVDSGESIHFSIPSSLWYLASRDRFEPRHPRLDSGHALAGPIEVRGARAGDTLAVRIEAVVPASWGVTVTRDGHELRWELADGVGRADGLGVTVELQPFLGVLGMPPPEPGIHSTIPPRACGGNIDCKELVAGTTLFLPVPVDGALFSAGDGHAVQGDGEVCGTAIECPVDAQIALDLRPDLRLDWPVARIDGAWLTFGFDEDLDTAAEIALDGLLQLMEREHGLRRPDALALASLCADLRVTQVVNGRVGVHAVLRDDAWR
jgi:acetamidase/formamidase